MDKQLIKIGLTKTGDPIKRHSIAQFVELAERGKPWRAHPMEIFYELDLKQMWYVPTEVEAKANEKEFKNKFTIEEKVGREVNGGSEIRELSDDELEDYTNYLTEKYPLQKRPKDHVALYICTCVLRPEPLPIPQILIDNFSLDWRP